MANLQMLPHLRQASFSQGQSSNRLPGWAMSRLALEPQFMVRSSAGRNAIHRHRNRSVHRRPVRCRLCVLDLPVQHTGSKPEDQEQGEEANERPSWLLAGAGNELVRQVEVRASIVWRCHDPGCPFRPDRVDRPPGYSVADCMTRAGRQRLTACGPTVRPLGSRAAGKKDAPEGPGRVSLFTQGDPAPQRLANCAGEQRDRQHTSVHPGPAAGSA